MHAHSATMRRVLAVGTLLVALIAGTCAPATRAQDFQPYEPFNPAKAQSLPTSVLAIQSGEQSHSFTVELADSQPERDIGLMHRDQLAADRGMLFDFQREQVERFWMRNTFIPLDMIFIRANGTIVYIAENTVPHSEAPVGPIVPVRAVLEVPGGTTMRLGLKKGDVVRHAIFGTAP